MGRLANRSRGFMIIAVASLAWSSAVPASAEVGNGVGSQFELAFWQSVAGSDDPAIYEAYLQQYPTGTFSPLARAKLANLRKSSPLQTLTVQPQPQPVATMQPAVAIAAPPAPALAPSPAAAPAALAVPVSVPQPEPAPLPTPETKRIAPVAVAVAPVVAVASRPVPAATVAQAAADTALLAELARSQEVGAGTLQVAASQGFALPARPAMAEVPELGLPVSFCSAEQRNTFYETRYKPVLDLARANNSAAVAFMENLQKVYDSFQLSRDPQPMNAIAAEASAYQQQVAALTYSRQSALVRQFDALMAVPLVPCAQVAAK